MTRYPTRDFLQTAYQGRTVVVTGHTGFKGAWLSEWLLSLGADVTGIALEPTTELALFKELKLEDRLRHVVLDIRQANELRSLIVSVQPDYVFHLAAQSLVRASYADPLTTFETNVQGTINVLDALRGLQGHYSSLGKICSSVLVTTDKCYENQEWLHGYRETDPLGGHDPYSASKAAAEIAIAGYRNSFFSTEACGATRPSIGVASARAGNVIGGGDWAEDRIVPDCVRSLERNQPVLVRNPASTRPWQHVLEPLGGYLTLGALQRDDLTAQPAKPERRFESAFNFGPRTEDNRTVEDLVSHVLKHWPGRWEDRSAPADVHEAGRLSLSWDKAFHELHWAPKWAFPEAVRRTADWYRQRMENKADARALTLADIEAYEHAGEQLNPHGEPR
jgi:CDP-glucose 4,6-dehydratase